MCKGIEIESAIERELVLHGTVGFRITGNSMLPLFLNQRDAVFLEKAVPEEIKKYDIVLYKASDKYILHRVVGKKDSILILRGDNTYIDEQLNIEDVLAIVKLYTRRGKSHSVKDFGFWFYSRFWTLIYPFRKFIRKVRIKLSRIRKTN